jgi:hypothetical protein
LAVLEWAQSGEYLVLAIALEELLFTAFIAYFIELQAVAKRRQEELVVEGIDLCKLVE